MTNSITVRVPATSANLGPGFDCLGLALGMTIDVKLWRDSAARSGREHPLGPMIVSAARAAFRAAGVSEPPDLSASVQGDLPIARGLGASAAARAAGIVAANAMINEPLDDDDLLTLGAGLEGHADNMAPALRGGLQLAVRDDDQWLYLGVPLHDGLAVALFVPDLEMPTQESRKLLPQRLSREDAVSNTSRAALLVAALAQGRWDLLDAATQDRLHTPARAKLFPAMFDVFAAARGAGAHAAYLSGGGSTIAALATTDAQAIAEAMQAAAASRGFTGQDHPDTPEPGGSSSDRSSFRGIRLGPACSWPIRYIGIRRAFNVSLIVHKYGGTSLADAQRIKNVAQRIAARRIAGDSLVVVVSAMGDSTDELRNLALQISAQPNPREMDILLSTGETVSMTLVAMALHELGVEAISLSGAQAGLRTDMAHGRARILALEPERIRREIDHGQSRDRSGLPGDHRRRGDHDSRPRRIGHDGGCACRPPSALPAARFTLMSMASIPPTLASSPTARKLRDISYEEMLELAAVGARVMHPRAVELGCCLRDRDSRRVELQAGAGHTHSRRRHYGGVQQGARHRPRHGCGEGHDSRRARPARHRRKLSSSRSLSITSQLTRSFRTRASSSSRT